MALTEAQVTTVVNAVVTKAEKMVANRVAARSGSAADVKAVKAAVAKRLNGK